MLVRNAGTEPVLIRQTGRDEVTVPDRSEGDTWSIVNRGRKAVSVLVTGKGWVTTLEPGDTWPRG